MRDRPLTANIYPQRRGYMVWIGPKNMRGLYFGWRYFWGLVVPINEGS
jgi:hypothetical protein